MDYKIELSAITSGYDRKTCWTHARGSALPESSDSVVVLTQKLDLTKTDCFHAINEFRTDDAGTTWSGPTAHSDSLGRKRRDDGLTTCPCDFAPAPHASSGKVLGVGSMAIYDENDLLAPLVPRDIVYSIYDAEKRTWSSCEPLNLPNDPLFRNAGAGSTQRVDLPNGEILLPFYCNAGSGPYSSVVVRCSFDGSSLTYLEHGAPMRNNIQRGLCEPSIAFHKGKYFLTLRNDENGYVATGTDGLNFDTPEIWRWDDGLPLGNYNTQQHWISREDALFLVYTRKAADNDNVFRHRAPLFIARVDPETTRVIRDSERVLVPNRGARLGNFGVAEIGENETWVFAAEWMQTTAPNHHDSRKCEKYGSDNTIFVAKLRFRL